MKTLLILAASLSIVVSGSAMANSDLAKSKNCMACHSVDAKLVGPAFKDVSKKYAGDKTAEAKLVTKVLKGSSGVWGANVMPANTQVSEADAKTLIKWILSVK
jgi:cytochrome c